MFKACIWHIILTAYRGARIWHLLETESNTNSVAQNQVEYESNICIIICYLHEYIFHAKRRRPSRRAITRRLKYAAVISYMRYGTRSQYMNSVAIILRAPTDDKEQTCALFQIMRGQQLWAMDSDIRHEGIVWWTRLNSAFSPSRGGCISENHEFRHRNGPHRGAERTSHYGSMVCDHIFEKATKENNVAPDSNFVRYLKASDCIQLVYNNFEYAVFNSFRKSNSRIFENFEHSHTPSHKTSHTAHPFLLTFWLAKEDYAHY